MSDDLLRKMCCGTCRHSVEKTREQIICKAKDQVMKKECCCYRYKSKGEGKK